MTRAAAEKYCCGCCGESAGRTSGFYKPKDSQFTLKTQQIESGELGWNLSYCGNCGVLSVDPLPSEFELNKIYEGDFYSNKILHGGIGDWMMQKPLAAERGKLGPWAQWKQNRMDRRDLSRVRSMAEPLKIGESKIIRFLDIGCGTGETLTAAAKLGWEARGIELSPSAADTARLKSGMPVFNGRFEDFSDGTDRYHIIHAGDVIEHLIEPRKLISWAESKLLPGGILRIQVPNDLEGFRMTWFSRIWWMFPPIHLHYFTPATLSSLLARHGFKIVSHGSLGESVGIDTRRNFLWRLGILKHVDQLANSGGLRSLPLEVIRLLWDRVLSLPIQMRVGSSMRGFVFWVSAQKPEQLPG